MHEPEIADRRRGAENALDIVVPDGESHFALSVLTCLGRRHGHRVHVVSSDPSARVRWSRYCTSFTAVDAEDEGARFERVSRLVTRVRADVVLPICETGTRLLQTRRHQLEDRVAIAPCAGTLELGDKWRLAGILRDAGLPHPPTLLYTADDAFRRQLGGFPLLIKPRHSSGGHGIRAFANRNSLFSFLDRHPEMAHEFVVQSLMPGHDIGSSVLCRDGVVLAQTVQRPLAADAHGFETATAIAMFDHPEAAALVRRLFEALGWSGVANVDLRVDERDGSLSVVDVNPRYWSSLLASEAAGVNVPHLACLAALGVPFAPPRQRTQRFLRARPSLRAWRDVLCGHVRVAPALHETIWPYLMMDPVPHVIGRLRRGAGRVELSATAIRKGNRSDGAVGDATRFALDQPRHAV